jgi:hypothetical protein
VDLPPSQQAEIIARTSNWAEPEITYEKHEYEKYRSA